MLSLEKQVVSLDLARRLEELGVAQESVFYWDKIQTVDFNLWRIGDVISYGMEENYDEPSPYAISAYTVSELGEILMRKGYKGRGAVLKKIIEVPNCSAIFNADYWARMLIYLLENRLISLEKHSL